MGWWVLVSCDNVIFAKKLRNMQ
ncbi:hypothetical protein A2U01_0069582, partial [Trifolium medium]|nr:hypothetical protein [Trifolium medium]